MKESLFDFAKSLLDLATLAIQTKREDLKRSRRALGELLESAEQNTLDETERLMQVVEKSNKLQSDNAWTEFLGGGDK